MENAHAQAQQELVYMKRLVDELTFKVQEAVEISMKDRLRANKMENASFTAAEDWQAELEAMEKQYQVEICGVRKAYEDLKLEFVAATDAKDEAVRLAGDAMLAAEVATKRAEFLSVELEKAKASIAESSREMRRFDQVLDELTKQKAHLTEAYAACHTAAQAGAAMVAEKEAELKKQMTALFQAKHQAELLRWELFEARQKESKLCEMDNILESLREQLTIAKEAEHQQAQVVMDTNVKLQKANSEIHQAKVAESEAVTLLILVQVELEETRQNWRMACAEVGTLTDTLKSMTSELESVQVQLWKLQERESCAWAEAAASEAKLVEATENLARALVREQSKDETVIGLTSLLDEVKREAQMLRQQIYEAIFEAHYEARKEMVKTEAAAKEEVLSLQKSLEVAQSIAGEARIDLQVAIGELHLARELAAVGPSVEHNTTVAIECASAGLGVENGPNQQAMQASVESTEAVKESLEDQAYMLRQALLASQAVALETASDLEVTRAELKVTRAEAEVSKAVAVEALYDANRAKQEEEIAQKGLSAAREEVLAEREQVRHAREEALAAAAKLEQLQRELSKASENALDAKRETRDKSREFLEPWEMVESGSKVVVTIRQEEYDALKLKVQEAEQFKVSVETEFKSLRCLNERLSTQLDAANMEIKALRMSEQNAWQQYEKGQQENLILEAEVQRLASKGEQLLKAWGIGHEAFSLNANALHSPPMERELQHESRQHSIYRDLSMSQKDEEEESTEFSPLSTKKKKKALFLRIGTYLTKRMNQ